MTIYEAPRKRPRPARSAFEEARGPEHRTSPGALGAGP